KAKLLLALGEREQMLAALLPFAREKQDVFWVWELMGEAFSGDEEKMLVCYSKALSCRSPEEMLVSLRQRMAAILIQKGWYEEARAEIDLLIKTRTAKGFKIHQEVKKWTAQKWFGETSGKDNNSSFYKKFLAEAEI